MQTSKNKNIKNKTSYNSLKESNYYKWGIYGLKIVGVIVIIGAGSHLLARSIRGINDLKSAINGN